MPSRLACLASFLTRLPLRCTSIVDAARGFPLVPIVGLIEGSIAALVWLALQQTPAPLRAAVLLAVHVAVTGGLHLDGFADYSDAIASGGRGPEALRVMKDPRRGSMAVVYTTVLLLAKYSGLLYAGPWLIIASYVASSEAMYVTAFLSPAVGEGLGSLFREYGVSRRGLAVSLLLAAAGLAASTAYAPLQALSSAAIAAAVAALVAWDARGRLGGFNGDVLGFAYELAHTASLVVGAAIAC